MFQHHIIHCHHHPLHECFARHYSLMMVAVCYQNIGKTAPNNYWLMCFKRLTCPRYVAT